MTSRRRTPSWTARIGAALSLFTLGTALWAGAAQAQEMDRPTARATWKAWWYNESATPEVKAKGKQGGPYSAEFRKAMLEAAAREKGKWGTMIPGVKQRGSLESTATGSGSTTGGTSSGMTSDTGALRVSGTAWANLGPTKADVAKNGGTSLAKTDAGRVASVVIDPANANTIYAGFSGGGVWKTVDGGSNWTPITENLGSLSVGALAIDAASSSTLYLGLGDAFDGTGIGMMKSIDGGVTWTGPVYLGDSTVINDIVSRPGVLLVATNTGVFRSTDGGASYARVTLPTGQAGNPYAWSIAWAGGSRFVASVEALPTASTGTTDGQIHVTSDNGATWTKSTGFTKTGGVGRTTLGVGASTRGTTGATATLYAMAAVPNATSASDLAEIFKSTNGGSSWTALSAPGKRYSNGNTESRTLATLLGGQGWYNQMVLVDPANANIAYFGGQLLVAKTTDGGSKFAQRSNWLARFSLPYVHADFHAGAIQGNTIIVGTDGGLFKSTDGGTTFTDTLNIGIASHLIYSVGSSPFNDNAIIGGFQDNGTRVRVGATSTFNQYIGGDGFGSVIHPTNGLMLGSLYYTRIYKSTTATGDVFNTASTGITESNNSASAPFNTGVVAWENSAGADTVFTFVNTKVYKSTNFATSWTALGTTGLTNTTASPLYIRGVGVDPSNVNRIGVVANGGRVFLTTNGGTSWTQAGALPNNGLSLSKVTFDPANAQVVYVASVAATATASHLWKSVDGGATFTAIDGGGFPTGVPVNTIKVDPTDSSALYAGTHLGVYRSLDAGATWVRFGSTMPLVNVTDLYISPTASRMRAATFGRGFWQLN